MGERRRSEAPLSGRQTGRRRDEPKRPPLLATQGHGPLLQRDYWAVIRNCRLPASEVAALVRERFAEFPPESLVVFRRSDRRQRPLEVGEELEIEIRMAGMAAVRVTHVSSHSLTLATLEGHPEAGRITFGAYPNKRGDVIFHIRSRARSSSAARYAGYVTMGDPMQTNTWTDFIDCLAHTVGDGVVGVIRVETKEMDQDEEPAACDSPTFIAQGD